MMPSGTDFAKMVPGFDFLQGLMKGASAGLPNMSQWIAPTLSPEEIDKRIEELRTVQFWLEQNAKLLGTTIQALEVQRMTLSTLQTMNMPLAELRKALEITLPGGGGKSGAKRESAREPAAKAGAKSGARAAARGETKGESKSESKAGAPPAVDPMQWWGALTQQFTDLAAKALRETAADAARNVASSVVKQSVDGAGHVLARAAAMPVKAAAATAGVVVGAADAAVKSARRRRG